MAEDSLRQLVLEDRGWTIHRIWSTDWFSDPDRELRKAVAAIERASIGLDRPSKNLGPEKTYRVEREDPKNRPAEGLDFDGYKETQFAIDSDAAPHEISIDRLAVFVTEIVVTEGPVHADEVARRLTEAWGLSRSGSLIREATSAALTSSEKCGDIQSDGDFYSVGITYMMPPRNRADVQSRTLLKADMLPPCEIRGAIKNVVEGHVGATPNDVTVEASRLFGFQRCGRDLRTAIEDQVRQMMGDGFLRLRDRHLYLIDTDR